ncbi:MAG TPA: DedA family protein [Solirubrobacteraceae bacterium]|nr:DedA family protein [Solirubrobacteraceae bacterium]
MSTIAAIRPASHPRISTLHAQLHHHSVVAKGHGHRKFRILGIHIHPHLRPQGPALDYIALFLFAMLSGIGINGFGEVALLGAGVYVANHKLPIEPVLLTAWLGAMSGGIIGWVIGWQAGRRLLTASGPLLHFRTKMLEHSEEVFYLHPSLAIVLTPAWAAGVEKVRWRPYVPLNALSALIWALPLGLGAYFLGSQITTEFSHEIGWVVAAIVVLFVVYRLVQRFLRAPTHRSR